MRGPTLVVATQRARTADRLAPTNPIGQCVCLAELIVITGPIGAGKSTVAHGLTERLRQLGRAVAVVDLDDVFEMGSTWYQPSAGSWQRAQAVHGALIAAWLRSGVDAVIAHGPFYTAEDRAALLAELPTGLVQRWVMLLAPFDAALGRVADDPDRNLSRDPGFLRASHERFSELLPDIPRCDWVFDTTSRSAEDIAATLGASLSATPS